MNKKRKSKNKNKTLHSMDDLIKCLKELTPNCKNK